MVAHEKFYYFDTGVYRALRPIYEGDTQEQGDGAALETLFLQSVRGLNEYLGLGYIIFFWRTVNGQEVDFILYGPHGLNAFEIHAHHTTKLIIVILKDKSMYRCM